jgi:hypothetical protein
MPLRHRQRERHVETNNNPEPGDNEAPEPEQQQPGQTGEETPKGAPPDVPAEDDGVEDGEMGEMGGMPPVGGG